MAKESASSKAARDNRANQLNPTHKAYHQARGASEITAPQAVIGTEVVRNNRANQKNPNNDLWWDLDDKKNS